jgi:hypothetical protein
MQRRVADHDSGRIQSSDSTLHPRLADCEIACDEPADSVLNHRFGTPKHLFPVPPDTVACTMQDLSGAVDALAEFAS